MGKPLADFIRPTSFDEVVGQTHLVGPHGILRRIIASSSLPNMIFYGPSGTGKTTIARIIAKMTERKFYILNATSASTSDIKDIIASLGDLEHSNGVLLYLDEIQYFSKKQQQSLLEFIENGQIVLIASTTENPYFYIYNAILSRSTIFEFKAVSEEEILQALKRAVKVYCENTNVQVEIDKGVLEQIARAARGDVRRAINSVELLFLSSNNVHNCYHFTLDDVSVVLDNGAIRYDRDGDIHYDLLSAFQKSIRGSDPDAAIHYLARLLSSNDIISPARRLLVIASEDIGLSNPQAISIVKACVDSAFQLGMPEARIPLAEAVLFLATAPKSNSAICAIDSALEDIKQGNYGDIPSNLQDTHYQGAEKLGHGIGYIYPHGHPHNYVEQQYLPDKLKNVKYYTYGDNKIEQLAKKYWDEIKKK